MLKLIAKFVGKPRDESELAFVTNPKAQKFMEDLPEYPPADLRRRFPSAGADAVDLLARMLVMRPDRRLSVDEALRHPYLRSLRDKKVRTRRQNDENGAEIENREEVGRRWKGKRINRGGDKYENTDETKDENENERDTFVLVVMLLSFFFCLVFCRVHDFRSSRVVHDRIRCDLWEVDETSLVQLQLVP